MGAAGSVQVVKVKRKHVAVKAAKKVTGKEMAGVVCHCPKERLWRISERCEEDWVGKSSEEVSF